MLLFACLLRPALHLCQVLQVLLRKAGQVHNGLPLCADIQTVCDFAVYTVDDLPEEPEIARLGLVYRHPGKRFDKFAVVSVQRPPKRCGQRSFCQSALWVSRLSELKPSPDLVPTPESPSYPSVYRLFYDIAVLIDFH